MGGFPALQIRGPEPLTNQVSGALQIQGQLQQRQLVAQQLENARLENEKQTIALQQNKTLNEAFSAAVTPNMGQPAAGGATSSSAPVFNQQAVLQHLAAGGAGSLIPGITKSFAEMDKAQGEVVAQRDAHARAADDYMGAALQAVVASKDPQTGQYNPSAVGAVLGHIATTYPQEAAQLRAQINANPDKLNQIIDGVVQSSQKQQELATQAKTAQGALLRGQAAAELVPSEKAKNAALTQEAITKTQQAGQVTPAIKYEQQQANYRALLGRQAESANATGRQGLENLQKQGDDYAKYSRQADAVKTAISQGLAGNQVAASLAPLGAAVFEMKANGDIARVNPQVFADVKGAGSLVERINGSIGQLQGTGPLSPQLSKDLGELIDKYQDVKYDSYKKQAEYTIKLHKDPDTNSLGRVNAHDVPILSKDGTVTTLGEAGKPTPKAPTGPPPEATHKVPGKDGKMHYTNAQGTKDLGVVPDGQ